VRRTIYTGVTYGLMRARITDGAEVGTAESMQGWEGRGRRIAQLVAWHVGIAGAPVIV
jgi:hypothetical protein